MQDDPKNLSLACMRCHQLFDDNPKKAQELPGFWAIMDDIKEMDEFYYNRLIDRL